MIRQLALAAGSLAGDNPFGLPPRTMDMVGTPVLDLAMEAPYTYRLLNGSPVSPDAPGILFGAGAAIYSETPGGPIYGHGGSILGYVSSLRHYADLGVTAASDLVPALETALSDLAIGMIPGREAQL